MKSTQNGGFGGTREGECRGWRKGRKGLDGPFSGAFWVDLKVSSLGWSHLQPFQEPRRLS